MPYSDSTNSHEEPDVICIKREPLYVWLARFVWVIGLVILLEYALDSRQEHEPQAAITASALFLTLLLAGIIAEVVRYVESQPESRLLRDMARTNANRNVHEMTATPSPDDPKADDMGDKDTTYE